MGRNDPDLARTSGAQSRRQAKDEALLLSVHARLARCADLDAQLLELMDILIAAADSERASLFLDDPRSGELYSRIAVGEHQRELRLLNTEGLVGAAFVSGESSIVHDAYADPRFNRRMDRLTGFTTHSALTVPLRRPDGHIVGVAQVLNKRSGTFGPEDLKRVQSIAEHAAMVLGNTLFAREVERSNAQEAAFLELVSEVSTEIQLGPLLQKIMVAVTSMLDAERSTLFLHDERSGELFTEIGQGLESQTIRMPNTAGIAGAVFTSGESINIPYAYADLRFNPAVDKRTGFFTRSILCAPVTNKDGKRIGVTQVLNKRGGAFTPDDESRLRAFTAQIAIGLENAKLFDDVQAMKQYNDRVLASMTNGVVTLDADGRIVTCNAAGARILRLEADELVGRAADDLFEGDDSWVLERVREAGETGMPQHAVDAELMRGGETVSVNLTALPLTDPTGQPMGSMILVEDISGEKRVRSTLSRYVDSAVADRLLGADADALGGRAGIASVLFADVRAFTPLTESLGPQATVALLNDYFTAMVACIEAEGGMLDKFIGDEIMAIFGVPYTRDDDADRAVRCAVEMMRGLRAFNAERIGTGAPALKIGIGINTGDVFSGNIGSPRRMDFTVMGDGVNLASRIEGLTKQYAADFLISEFTLKALKSTFRTREVDRVIVKGKSVPVGIHEVLDHHDATTFPNLLDTLYAYRNGVEFYRARRFQDAITAFEEALHHHPADTLSTVYRDRCRHFIAHPPGDDWDVVWVATRK